MSLDKEEMSVENVDAIQCLSKDEVSVENISNSKGSTQSVNELCMEREKNSILSTSFRRNYVLTSQMLADRVLDYENTEEVEHIRHQKRKQLVRQRAATEDQLEGYRITSLEHKEECVSETRTSSKSPSQLVYQDERMTSIMKNGEEEVLSDVIHGYQSRPHSRTERIIYSERIDISPCSISSRDGTMEFSQINQEQKGIIKLKKQKTIESVPSNCGSSRYLLKQFSTASSSSAFLSAHPSPTSSIFDPLTPKLTIIRGQSCSLVDIPTYLGSSVEIGNISEINRVEAIPLKTPDRVLKIKEGSKEKMKTRNTKTQKYGKTQKKN